MQKHGIQIIGYILLFALLLSALLACGKTESGTETEQRKMVEIISSQASDYILICPEKGDSAELSAAQSLRRTIKAKLNFEIPIKDDFVKPGTLDENPKEILVGHVKRDATNAFLAELGEDGYGFSYKDGKLVIVGATPALTAKALTLFMDEYMRGEDGMASLQIPEELHTIEHAYASYKWLSLNDQGIKKNSIEGGSYVANWISGEDLELEQLLSPTGRTGTVTGDKYDYGATTGDFQVKWTDKLTDGKEETITEGMALWSGSKKDTATDTYINYDYGELYYIYSYKLRPSFTGMTWDLEYSEDGEHWDIADSYTDGGWIHSRSFAKPFLAQYVRFHITHGSMESNQFFLAIREIWMQGVPEALVFDEPVYIAPKLQYEKDGQKYDYEYYYDYNRSFIAADLGKDYDIVSYEVTGFSGKDVKCYFSSASNGTVWQSEKMGLENTVNESGRRYVLFSFPKGTKLKDINIRLLTTPSGGAPVRTITSGKEITAYVMPKAQAGVNVVNLSGEWQYTFNPSAVFYDPLQDASKWSKIQVPSYPSTQGVESANDQKKTYNHEVAYRKTVPSPLSSEQDRYFLRFDSALNVARIWVNGQFIGAHTGGYCAFEYEITDIVKTGADLQIVVGTTHVSYAPELNIGDAGLTGDISIIGTKTTHLARLHTKTTLDTQYKDGQLLLSLLTDGQTGLDGTFTLMDPNGQTVLQKQTLHVDGGKENTLVIPVTNPQKWDAEHPNLYTLKIEFSNGLTYERKVGFRSVEISGQNLLVNGKPVTLRGVDWTNVDPTAGLVPNYESDREALIKLKLGNVNYIRTAHFAPSDEILDLMDEIGFYVELESTQHINTHWKKDDYERIDTLNNPAYRDWTLGVYTSVYERTAYHTGIIIWSTSNESDFGANAETVCKYLRTVDTRPIKYSWGYDIPAGADYIDIKSSHYPKMSELQSETNMPTIYDEYAHLYWKQGVDAGLRAMYGVSLKPFWEAILSQEGGLGGAIWQSRDFMFFGEQGPFSFNDTWGLLDAWNREKPEYYNAKRVYSPIYLDELMTLKPSAGGITFEIGNRFDHTNLDEVKLIWTCGSEKGEMMLPSIAPHKSGQVTVPVKNAQSGDKLTLVFVGKILGDKEDVYNSYVYPLGGWTAPTFAPVSEKTAPAITDGSTISVKGENFTLTVDKKTFKVKATVNDEDVMDGVPTLMLDGVAQTGFVVSSVTADTVGHEAVITMKGNYTGAKNVTVTLAVDADGRIAFTYGFAKTKNYETIALSVPLTKDVQEFSWNGRPTIWNDYPENEIGSLSGTALREYGNEEVYRKKPTTPWSQDSSAYNRGTTGRHDASRLFLASRFGIDELQVKSTSGSGVKLEADFVGTRMDIQEGQVSLVIATKYTVQGAQERDFVFTHDSGNGQSAYEASFVLRLVK